jgi:hypothetical protein
MAPTALAERRRPSALPLLDGETMIANLKLQTRLKDPQSWIGLIALLTAIGLCSGAFEPPDRSAGERTRRAVEAASADTVVAASEQAGRDRRSRQ